jgi:diguanylate cyclase (GGDEF)-like protein/PAS domain S-box-containing protein
VGIAHTTTDGQFIRVNSKLCDILGYSSEELLALTTRDLTHPDDRDRQDALRRELLAGKRRYFSANKRYLSKNGEQIWVNRTVTLARGAARGERYLIQVIEDITERKRSEARVARLSQARSVMTECSQALVRATSEQDLFHETCRILVESGGYRQAWVGVAVDDEKKSIKIGGSAGYETGYLESLQRSWAGEGRHRGIMGRVIATGEPHVSQNILTDADLAERRARALDRNYQSSVSLPLKDQERIIGGISIYATESDAFDDEELKLLKGLVDDVAFGIAVLRMRIAREQAEAKSREHERQFRETFDQAAVGIVHTSLDGKYLQVNRKFCDMLGYSESELLGQAAGDFTHIEDRERGREYRQPLWAGKLENFQEEKRYVRRDGRVIWTNRTVSLARDAAGKPLYFIRIIEDITDRKEVAERYRATFDNAPVGIMHTDVETDTILHANPKLCDMLGHTPDELLGMTTDQILEPECRGTDRLHYREQMLNGEIGTFSSERKFLRKDGSPVWVNRNVSLVRDAAGTPLYFIRIIEDISDRREAEDRLKHLAHYDALTGLPNRVLFHDRLRQALAQARRNNWVAAVLFIDLDRFKNVNDTLGHSAGDRLLKQVSERLAACVRSGDTVGRLGGDEFAIALTNISSPGDASVVAQKVRAALGGAFPLGGTEVFVTSSIGITLFPTDSEDLDVLIRNADTAMYRAKDLGRNNYQFYTPEMNAHALEKLSLENSLRRALERNEFLLYYQPKVSLATGEVTGVEALLRWLHPEIGLVAPAEFMPMLEETGLIVPTGEWVIRAACAQLTAWRQTGVKPVSIAVNLSARQFQARDLGASIARILDEEGVEHGLLEFEITESSLVNNTEEAAQTLAFLNTLGVRVAIDDFGTGYSSLSYLKRFPLDALKIDGSFVRDITTDADDAAITRAIITMAHHLELSVIAEGVETEDQLNFLTANGCDQIQGYYFSFPLSAVECTALLKDGRRLHRSGPGASAEARPVLQDGTAVLSGR